MLRLAFVTGSLPHGGAERQTISLLKTLAARGHDCHAVCVKPAPVGPAELELPPSSTLESLDAQRYLDHGAIRRFAALITRTRPQAIIAANGYALMYASLARALAGVRPRLVAIWHSTQLPNVREWLQMLAYRPLFWRSDCTVFLCERQRRYWRRRALFSNRNELIPNGIDAERFRDRPALWPPQAVRSELGFGPDDLVIGLPALFRPEKNHVQLVEAVAALRSMGIRARALMIGDGSQRAAVEARAAALGVAGHVVITGLRPDVRPCLAACDIVTLCSLAEAFSLAALEAMAMGKPLVLSDVGGAAEMVEPGWNGLLFRARDTGAYVNCLVRLSDAACARRMGSNARRAVEQRFSDTAMTDQYEKLLVGLCR
jgi:glycosyltransferase involved in cell wall biosynthesis